MDPTFEAERARDGRNVDPELGLLAGEGAQQRVKTLRAPPPPERAVEEEAGPSYHGLPLLKEPVWRWYIPTYFAVGGLAGACGVLGAVAQLAGGRGARDLVDRCRLVATGGALLSAGLLVADLGRPARFLNMLRVFRPTSPMNMGTYVLTGFGVCSALSALPTAIAVLRAPRALPVRARFALARRRPPRTLLQPRRTLVPASLDGAGDAAGLAAGLLGLPFVGYTGVLISNTAVPVWLGTRRTLPVLFAFSGAVSASGLFDLWRPRGDGHEMARRFGVLAKGAEVALFYALDREARIPRVRRPLRQGLSGALLKSARLMTAASLVLDLLAGRGGRRGPRTAAGALALLGTLALRFGIHEAGRASARDPHATFAQQQAERGAAGLVRTGEAPLPTPSPPGVEATGKESAELGSAPSP